MTSGFEEHVAQTRFDCKEHVDRALSSNQVPIDLIQIEYDRSDVDVRLSLTAWMLCRSLVLICDGLILLAARASDSNETQCHLYLLKRINEGICEIAMIALLLVYAMW